MNTTTIYRNALLKLSQSDSKKTAALAQQALDTGSKMDEVARQKRENIAALIMRQMGGD